MAVADMHVGLQRERTVGVLQRDHAAGLAIALERRALVAAGGLPGEQIGRARSLGVDFVFVLLLARRQRLARSAAGRACGLVARIVGLLLHDLVERNRLLQRLHVHLQFHLAHRIVVADLAAVEADRAQIHLPRRRFIALAEGEVPVGLVRRLPFEIDHRVFQLHAGNDDAMRQQRQRRHAHAHCVQLRELRLLRPLGVGDADIACDQFRPRNPAAQAAFTGLAAPCHAEVALDDEGPAHRLAHLVVDGGLEAIPVVGGDDQHRQRQQGHRQCG